MIELKERAARESRTLTDVVSEALARGLACEGSATCVDRLWRCTAFDMGGGFEYTKAWERIDHMEAAAVADKLDVRK